MCVWGVRVSAFTQYCFPSLSLTVFCSFQYPACDYILVLGTPEDCRALHLWHPHFTVRAAAGSLDL